VNAEITVHDRRSQPAIAVFCGANPGHAPEYAVVAAALGRCVAAAGCTLVYGGASVGTMGVLADAALRAGGTVTGVIPRSMVEREVAHRGLADLRITDSMHERKALMLKLADAVAVLPGGLGTLDELFEVVTLNLLSFTAKPVGLVNGGYYDGLLAFLGTVYDSGFSHKAPMDYLIVDSNPGHLVARLLHAVPRRQ